MAKMTLLSFLNQLFELLRDSNQSPKLLIVEWLNENQSPPLTVHLHSRHGRNLQAKANHQHHRQ